MKIQLRHIMNLIWPKRCPSCQATTKEGEAFCPPCNATLIPPEFTCVQCGQTLGIQTKSCDRCYQQGCPMKSSRWAFEHGAAAKNAIHELKYRDGVWIAETVASFFTISPQSLPVDVVVPVPLSRQRLRKRHYNQAALIAHHIAKRLTVPLSCDSLVKTKHTPPQVGLSARQRQTNLIGAFRCARGMQGLRVLLIDDVSTTGTTLWTCADALKRAGALSVDAWTFTHDG